jgi:uncharacterized membrane protein
MPNRFTSDEPIANMDSITVKVTRQSFYWNLFMLAFLPLCLMLDAFTCVWAIHQGRRFVAGVMAMISTVLIQALWKEIKQYQERRRDHRH